VTSLAHPGGSIIGVTLFDVEFYAKRLQILKEAVPSASKIAWLDVRSFEGPGGRPWQQAFQEANLRLQISLIPMLLQESTPSEYQRVFAEIAQNRPDAIVVSDIGDLIPYRQLILELVEKSRLPAIYGYREFVEAGGLMAYAAAAHGRRRARDPQRRQTGRHPDL